MSQVSVTKGCIGLLAVAALGLVGCTQGEPADAGPAPTRSSPSDSPAAGEPVAGSEDPGSSEENSAPVATTTVAIYLTEGESLERVERTVPEVPRIGTEALRSLLAGPTATEATGGLGTAIPVGTRLLDLAISDGTATVDLSRAFESGGGTLGLTLRLAQVACTLDQFESVEGVRFALEGELLSVFSGDGIVVDRPVSCASYRTYLSEPGSPGGLATTPTSRGTPSARPGPGATSTTTTLPPDPGDVGTFAPGADGVHGGPTPGSDEDCASTTPVGPC